MSKIINNIKGKICGTVMTICMLLSCRNMREHHHGEVKLVTQKIANGTTKVIGAIIYGKKQGMWVKYDDSGRISSSYTYVNDSLIGEEITYWEDGKIALRHYLKNDEIQGEWIGYHDYEKNKIAEKGSYKNGNKVGVWEYYIEDGRLDKKIEYTNKKEKIILNNHLSPEISIDTNPLIVDSTIRAFVTDSNGKEIVY
jgi:hypothetical protein